MLSIVRHVGDDEFEIAPLLEDKRYYVKITDMSAQALLSEIERDNIFDVEISDDTIAIKSTAWLER